MDFESLKFAYSLINLSEPLVEIIRSYTKTPCQEVEKPIPKDELKTKAKEMLKKLKIGTQLSRSYGLVLLSEIPKDDPKLKKLSQSEGAARCDEKQCSIIINDVEDSSLLLQEPVLLFILTHEIAHYENDRHEKGEEWAERNFPKIKGEAPIQLVRWRYSILQNLAPEIFREGLEMLSAPHPKAKNRTPDLTEEDFNNLVDFHKNHLSFKRSTEYEADIFGIIEMVSAGFDPTNALCALSKMQKEENRARESSKHEIKEENSTHPTAENRRKKLEEIYPALLAFYSLKKFFDF